MNIPDDLDMCELGMDVTGFQKGITCKLVNETDPGCPQECVGYCGKAGRGNSAMELPYIGRCNGTYNGVILD